MNLVNRWTRLFGTNTLTKFDNLLSSYSKNFYHSLTFHIANCLIELDKYYLNKYKASHITEKCYIERQNIEIALWFHDAKSTELKSFEYLVKLMGPKYDYDTVKQLILATNHHQLSENSNFACAIICDIDLSILGQNRKVFDLYEKLIRIEYGHIPDKYYKPGRIKVLNRFFSRENIYYTDYFRQKYEKKARDNISFSLKCLK